MTKLDDAYSELQSARDTFDSWKARAAAKRQEAEDLEAGAGTDVLADETHLDGIAARITDLQAASRLYDKTAEQARANITARWRDVLALEEAALNTSRAKLTRDADKLQGEALAALADLEAKFGWFNRLDIPHKLEDGTEIHWTIGGANALRIQAERARIESAVVEVFLKTGKLPSSEIDMREALPDWDNLPMYSYSTFTEYWPAYLQDAAKEMEVSEVEAE